MKTTRRTPASGGAGVALRLAPLLLVLLLGGCRPDPDQAQLCRGLIAAFEPQAEQVTLLSIEPAPADPAELRVRYRARGAERWITCRFAGSGLDSGRLSLAAVATDRGGALGPVALAMLRIWRGLPEGRTPWTGAWSEAAPGWLYLLQTAINAIALCALYALLATGFSLIYGIVERFNLALGALAMVGGFAVILAVGLFVGTLAWPLAVALPAALLAALAVGALHGWASDRLIDRRLRGGHPQAVLIATIGLALFLQEYVRLVQGTRDHWLQPLFPQRLPLVTEGGASVYLGGAQLAVAGLALAAFAGLALLLGRSGLGRRMRAVADDARMAALVGVNVDATVGAAYALGGLFAGLAGTVIALYYGGLDFFTGAEIGFKALAAAIVGGIGSLAGAALGGLIIGLLETFWSAYLTIAYKDIAIFALLALILVLRPHGLLGKPRSWHD